MHIFSTFSGFIYLATLSFIVVSFVTSISGKFDFDLKRMKIPSLIVSSGAIILLYFSFMEIFIAYYSGAKFELMAFELRWTGPYSWILYTNLIGLVALALLLIPRLRESKPYLVSSSVFALIFSSSYSESLLTLLTTGTNFG